MLESEGINPSEDKKIDLYRVACLVVDDNLINQKILCKLVKRLGIDSDVANNGVQAVEAVQQKTYDLIFMDIQMPLMDGIEATQKILNDSKIAKKPIIIAVTANTSDDAKKKCRDCGMKDFLSKPITFKVVQNAIHQWFA
jgi:CheY-like chemotaxis protein